MSVNRKKVLNIRWVRNREGETIRRRCGLVTAERSGRRIITAGPHRRGDESTEEEEANTEERCRKQSQKLLFFIRDNCSRPSRLQALNIIAYADCSSYENTALHANWLSEEMLWHESWLQLQGGVICEG